MKALALLAIAALVGGALLVPAQEAEAVAYCVIGDVINTGGSPCYGYVCMGYSTGYGWHDCIPGRPCTMFNPFCPGPLP